MGREAIDRQGLPRQSEPEPAEDERPPAAAQAGLLELQRAHGNQAVTRMLVARHPVQHVPAHHRATKLELLGDGTAANPGMQLGTFESSTRAQADWFAEPTLTDADRDKVWPLLRRASQSFVLSGAGDVLIGDLLPLSAGDWRNLIAFGRACEPGNTTHVVDASVYPLAQRIAMGKTLLELEQVVQPDVLRLTTNEAQLKDIHTAGLVPQIAAYWAAFSPHMQEQPRNEGERGPEFQRMLDMLAGGGHGRFAALLGRVRNLHRFSAAMLTQLIANFADHTRARPADLILHTGHDESAFNESAFLFSDLVVNSPHNVLFLEGQASLAAITAEIPKLTAAYGQPDDKGVPRLAQTMIAGHGEARVTELAGTGNERVEDEQVVYDSESLDLDNNNKATVDLLDALESNMDPKTAR
ncbi:MAG: hypothetical protein QOF55_781, partial [Thermoleophilaceae bacterium]|nr:hypothetical protein [Thermoleophilaceae bacterium]